MIVVIQPVLTVVSDIEVWPAVIIIISHRYAESPALVCNTCSLRRVAEGAIMIVVEEHGARRGLLAFHGGDRRTI